jgi:transcriptional regulator with XRE-family HTH domain
MGQKRTQSQPREDQEIGRAITVLRHELGLNRKELAERSGISYPFLSEVEGGKKSPSSKTVRAIADALGVRVHQLLEVAEGLRSPEESPGTWVMKRSSKYFHDESPAAAFSMPPPAPATAAAPPPDTEPAYGDERPEWLIEDLNRIARGLVRRDLELLVEMARRMAR